MDAVQFVIFHCNIRICYSCMSWFTDLFLYLCVQHYCIIAVRFTYEVEIKVQLRESRNIIHGLNHI